MNSPDIYFPNLGIEVAKLHREAFSLFGLDVYWYGIIITMGIMIGIYLSGREAKKTGQSVDIYYDFAIIVILCAFVGARLYYVAFKWEDYKDNLLKIFAIREGGIAIYGAVIAAALTAIIYTRVKKIKFGLFVDTIIPSLILGQAIGRWGNFFNKEAFGGYTNNLFAMAIKKDVASYIPDSLVGKDVLYKGVSYIQVHPTFLYESLWNLMVFLILIFYKRHKKYNGELLVLYLIGYSLGRVWIEGLRTDQLLIAGTNMPVSQLLSAILLICATIYEIYKLLSKKRLTNNV
ncbi:MAG: prolipoprotein diacylglyceryl transferase [Clostridiales bacterium GWE2_32_10]|nr:MAG: prolipoprotein diacylglyceryl transferase [Clostridiales bacterium GWE2_32_10]HBY20418.1 prolipoprotein diacylglyceryl transferase [Clostridiales bacterium]